MPNDHITVPTEDTYHKYPVLKIPTDKHGEVLIIGTRKARAVINHFDAIKAFAERHPDDQ